MFLTLGKLGRLGQSSNKAAAKRILDIFSTTQAATNVQIPLILNIPAGKTVYIDWGDGGSLIECAGTGADVTYKSNYTTSGDFNVKLLWDYGSIIAFKILATNAIITFSKGIKNLKNLKLLDIFYLSSVQNLTATGLISDFPRVTNTFYLYYVKNLTATGLISDFPRVTNTFYLYSVQNLTATGLISDFPALTSLNSILLVLNCPNISLTIDTPPVWKNTTITLHVGLTTTQVNNFVKLWAQVTEDGGVKNVNIAGNNEPLTESDPDVAAALQILSDKNKVLAYNI